MCPAAMAGLYNPAASGLGFLSCETDDHPRTRASLGRCEGRRPWGGNVAGWLTPSFCHSLVFRPDPAQDPRACGRAQAGPCCSAPGRGGPRKTPTQSVPSLITPWEGAGPPLPLSPCLAGEEAGGHRVRASLYLRVLSPPGRWGSRATSPHSCSGPAGARKTLLTRGWLAGATGSDPAVTPSDGELTPSHALLPNGLKPASLSWTSRVSQAWHCLGTALKRLAPAWAQPQPPIDPLLSAVLKWRCTCLSQSTVSTGPRTMQL